MSGTERSIFSSARTAVTTSALLAVALSASAQTPLGPEFRVDTGGSVDQYTRSSRNIAMAPDGGFVVTWATTNHVPFPDDDLEVRARRFDAAGVAQGPVFAVNTYTTRLQYDPSVAMDAAGNFVVVWNSNSNAFQGTLGQRFDASGSRLGAEFVVRDSLVGSGGTLAPTVAVAPGGAFLAVWQEYVGPGNSNVMAQRFDAAGNAVGSAFQVNDATNTHAQRPVVDVDSAGNFVVVWFASFSPTWDVLGRRLSSTGAPLGVEFRVSSTPGGSNYQPAVASAPDGSFAVAWQTFGDGIRARRFDAAGSAITPDLAVATTGRRPSVDIDTAGDFVVAWSATNGSDFDVFATRFTSTGVSAGPSMRVNSYTTGDQGYARVAGDPAGNFVVAWLSEGQNGVDGVFAQRFAGGLSPAGLVVDYEPGYWCDGNGVFEVNEEVKVAPGWLNGDSVPQTFSGALFSYGGPGQGYPPPADPGANYGTVAPAVTGRCTDTGDCYAVGFFSLDPRPVTHWDATLGERLLPVSLGAEKVWTLHIGGSFTDVPRANPFYRFVETVLHRDVTGGCTATQYCPASPASREQMAVFVLVAKEGAGNTPPACTTPMFSDVPASSPFCPWIEELARRGVVSGCGGGNYCPTAAVTREQMAVFVLATKEPGVTPPACGTPMFTDVPASSPFCPWIEELARRGVVAGCGGGNYCPTAPVTREEMAVFISSGFGLQLYGP